jgi:chromosome segregation ATPase
VGSLNGRVSKLEGRVGIPKAEAEREEERRMSETRARVIAELNAFEARIRSMSEAEHRAWRESEECQAEIRALEEQIERRRRGGA